MNKLYKILKKGLLLMPSKYIFKSKHLLTTILVLMLTLIMQSKGNAQFVISGTSSPGISIGYDLDYLIFSVGGDFEYNNFSNKYSFGLHNQNQTSEEKRELFSITPNLGLKIYLNRSNFSTYISGTIGLEIPVFCSVKGFRNNNETKSMFEDQNNDGLFKGGIGMEKFFMEKFSIGGEFGVIGKNFNYNRDNILYIYEENYVVSDVTYSHFELKYYFSINLNYYVHLF